MTPQSRQSYHPFVMVAFYLQFLPEEILGAIPRSTRHEWQHKPVTQLFYLVQDNFSRAILGGSVNACCRAVVMMELVRDVHNRYL